MNQTVIFTICQQEIQKVFAEGWDVELISAIRFEVRPDVLFSEGGPVADQGDSRGANVGLSWVALNGNDEAANRFCLEDLAIGLMRPILNIDVER
jgi:hypothetical protein